MQLYVVSMLGINAVDSRWTVYQRCKARHVEVCSGTDASKGSFRIHLSP